MARNDTVTLTASDWTQLTNADATAVTFANRGQYAVLIKGTADATQPTTAAGAITYGPGMGEKNQLLTELFPNLSAVRLWAYSKEAVDVSIHHA